MSALRSEFLMQLSADLDEPLVLGDAPLGARRIMYFRRGAFSGPRLKGEVLPGGGDWVLLRRDGSPNWTFGSRCAPTTAS